jgi:putative DNA primase/helicase
MISVNKKLKDLTLYQLAQFYASLGLSVIPIKLDGSKRPAYKWTEYESKPATKEDLRNWFDYDIPEYGIGVVCGTVSGNLEVLDFEGRFADRLDEYIELVAEADENLWSKLFIVGTPTGGRHVYYRCEKIEHNQNLALKSRDEKYIETRGEGGYVIGVGSPVEIHPSRIPYKRIQGVFYKIPTISPRERDILIDCARSFNEYIKPERVFKPDVNPKALKSGIKPGDVLNADPNARAFVERLLIENGCEISGSRVTRPGGNRPSASLFPNGVLYNFSPNWKGLEADKAYSPFSIYGLLECGGDFKEAATRLLKQGYGKTKAALVAEKNIETADGVFSAIVESLPKTIDIRAEAGLAKQDNPEMREYAVVTIDKIVETARCLGFDFRFSGNMLYVFNTQYWLKTDIKDNRQKISDALISFVTESSTAMGMNSVKDRFHTYIDHLCKQFITMVSSSQIRRSKNDKTLINFKNGTLEIDDEGYNLRDFDRRDFLTYQLQFDYDPNAEAARWKRFLDEVLPPDNDPDRSRQKVLAEYFGSCFTDLKIEKCLFLYGSGSNGKSVVFNVITTLFGKENVSCCSLKNLLSDGSYLASIHNKLLNYSSETSPNVDAELLKTLASREPVDVRRVYEPPFSMEDYARLAFNANELPKQGKEYMYAFKRRLAIIPFDVKISPDKADPYLAQRIIQTELSGVMNWVLEGLSRLLKQGRLSDCELSDKAVDRYMAEGDIVAQWLEDRGWIEDETLQPKQCKQLKELVLDFNEWCKKYDQNKTLGRDQLKKRLAEMHYIHPFDYRHVQLYRLKRQSTTDDKNFD